MALPPQTNRSSTPKQPELKFQPLSEGLGFHPFSDGLPYAPIAKTQTSRVTAAASTASRSSGSGATVAGPVQYARISVPVATQVASKNQKPTQAALPAAQPPPLEADLGAEYVFKRVFAYLLDTIINTGLCAGALSAALWKENLSPELLLNPGIVLLAGLFLGVFNWAITTAQEVAFGTSIGKRLFGLALQGTASALFLRAFFFIPSLCFAGIGLIWALFDRKRRCWHDLVVDLQPIEINNL
ncbi:RDD family protein [Bdellovibrionota bacterium FG-1]